MVSSLEWLMRDHGVDPSDIYNFDESGFQMGIGRDQWIGRRESKNFYGGLNTNRECIPVVEAIRDKVYQNSAAARDCAERSRASRSQLRGGRVVSSDPVRQMTKTEKKINEDAVRKQLES